MSESAANPQILVTGEAEEQQDDTAAAEEQSPSVSLDEGSSEGSIAAEKETQPKMQSVLRQVRRQIRSQVGTQASKISILELIQALKDNEIKTAQVNDEHQEQQDDAAAAEGQSVSPDEEGSEDSIAAESLTQAKMQSVLQQVRKQIRSEAGMQAPKSSILELIQKIREMKIAQVEGEEEKQAELLTDESKIEMDREELCAIFEAKLEASNKALRDEFGLKVFRVRAEMQAYTDQALKDFEFKMQSCNNLVQPHPKEQQESKGSDKKQKPTAPPSLAARRGRVLTRTMTTMIPKTCAPVITGQRAKSETLSSSKGGSSKLLLRDPTFPPPYSKQCKSCKPLLPPAYPPAYPPLHQGKRTIWGIAKTGN